MISDIYITDTNVLDVISDLYITDKNVLDVILGVCDFSHIHRSDTDIPTEKMGVCLNYPKKMKYLINDFLTYFSYNINISSS